MDGAEVVSGSVGRALGVIVPCRNEGLVIARKLANLARAEWPDSEVSHQIVVVDDGSSDGTAVLARALVRELFPAGRRVAARVVTNDVRAGKPGAIRRGLAEIEGRVELVVLTDADVVIDPGALCALARAFHDDPALALACGAQRFVRTLAHDGQCASPDGGELVRADSGFDRWTARARALESRFGALFSVHGQLLAWRADLALVPRLGLAADDIDLRMQVRARTDEPRAVRLVAAAPFFEVKTRAEDGAEAQALRRARAYVQVVRAHTPPRTVMDRAQFAFYRFVPMAAPTLTWLVPLALVALAWAWLGAIVAGTIAIAYGVLLASAVGRRWLALMRVIRAAAASERHSPLPEQWEMARR